MENKELKLSLSWEDVKALCIRKEWYTAGTNEDYEKLRSKIYGHCGFNANEIEAITDDIWEHTAEKTKPSYERMRQEILEEGFVFIDE